MPTARATAYVGVGSNLAVPRAQVERALRRLAGLPHSRLLRSSRLYRSAPWGVLDQPDFVNAVAAIETGLSPQAALPEPDQSNPEWTLPPVRYAKPRTEGR